MALSALLALAAGLAAAGPWRPVVPGLELRQDEAEATALVALRVDLARHAVEVVLAADLGRRAATAAELGRARGALAAVNGGFFDPELRPVGVRLRAPGGLAGSPRASFGTLVFTATGAAVRLGAGPEALGDALAAVQCSPRLVIAGRPNRLRPQSSRRTAAGIDGQGRLVLLVTGRGLLEASELAALLARPEAAGGYGLVDALNLDGGGSSQLWLSAGGVEIDVPGLGPVSDALVVMPRPRPSREGA